MDLIPRASIPACTRHHVVPRSFNLLPNAKAWRLQHGRRFSLREERNPEFARRLSQPVRMKIVVCELVFMTENFVSPEIEYVFDGTGDNEFLSRILRYSVWRVGNRLRKIAVVFGRGGNQYEMFSFDSEHLHTDG